MGLTPEDDLHAYFDSPFYDPDADEINDELDEAARESQDDWEDYLDEDEAEHTVHDGEWYRLGFSPEDDGFYPYDISDIEQSPGIAADLYELRQRLEGTVFENIPVEVGGLEEKLTSPAPAAPVQEERINFVSPSGQKDGYLFS